MSFDSLGLAPELLRAVSDQGYAEPTAVQQQAIPLVLSGRDLLAGAQTGTGKTAAFTLPLLQRLSQEAHDGGRPRALVLTPTRELAAQVQDSVRTYGRHLRLRSTAIFGGVKINPQIQALRRGVDIVVATPGRLMDHMRQGNVELSQVAILVLDEADRMLDMGFLPDIRRILAALPKRRQNLLFSATYNAEIRRLAATLLHDPAAVEIQRKSSAASTVHQIAHPVDRERKPELLSKLIGAGNWRQVLVFTRTKRGADKLARQLGRSGIHAEAIHGGKTQGARTRALANFKKGRVRALVATDIAARGLDIQQLPHVVNFDLPQVAEDYVHRIGRTGRAGESGTAVSLVSRDEIGLLRNIERVIRRRMDTEPVVGFEPQAHRARPAARPAPPPRRANPRRTSMGGYRAGSR